MLTRATDTLLVSSVANAAGTEGAARDGNVEVVAYDLAGGTIRRTVLHHGWRPTTTTRLPCSSVPMVVTWRCTRGTTATDSAGGGSPAVPATPPCAYSAHADPRHLNYAIR